ncbi:MAG: hypothetical protein XE04_0547 [Marinimicrobia bacterium 46_43]|nr:MAG: hypothetical protein XE04_0547 [Marinimicrobia bacterium 46_43]
MHRIKEHSHRKTEFHDRMPFVILLICHTNTVAVFQWPDGGV